MLLYLVGTRRIYVYKVRAFTGVSLGVSMASKIAEGNGSNNGLIRAKQLRAQMSQSPH